MSFSTQAGDTLQCPGCEQERGSSFRVTRLKSGTLIFRCADCGESLEHLPAISADSVIKFGSEHLGPSAAKLFGSLFKGDKND